VLLKGWIINSIPVEILGVFGVTFGPVLPTLFVGFVVDSILLYRAPKLGMVVPVVEYIYLAVLALTR
jgi:hypothetical protein